MGRTLIRLALAFLIVGSVVANPLGLAALDSANPTGDASAVSITVECSPQELTSPGETCDISTNDGEIEDIQDHTGIYTEATSLYAQSKTLQTVYTNTMMTSEDVAWLVANNETAHAYQSGYTKAETKTRAREAVNQYFTVKQLNYLEYWDQHVASYQGLINQSSSISGPTFGTDGVFNLPGWEVTLEFESDSNVAQTFQDSYTGNKTITLLNGSTEQIREIRTKLKYSPDGATSDAYGVVAYNPHDGVYVKDYGGASNGYAVQGANSPVAGSINVRPPTSDYTTSVFISNERWDEPYSWEYNDDDLMDQRDEVINESDMFVEQTWLDWEAGEINASDVIAQTNAMNRWQVDSTSDNATFNDVVAGLAASGLSTPPLNETSYLNLTFNPVGLDGNLTAQGMLLSSAPPPNGTWEIGKTYDTGNLSGAQMIVALGETGSNQYQLNQTNTTLRVNGAYDADGDKQNITSLESETRDFEVSNTSQQQKVVLDLGKFDEQLEQYQASGGGGGGGGDDSDTDDRGLWEKILGTIADGIMALASLVGLGGFLKSFGPVVLVGLAAGVLVAIKIFTP